MAQGNKILTLIYTHDQQEKKSYFFRVLGTWCIAPLVDFVLLAFCELRDVHLEWLQHVVPVLCLTERVTKPRRVPLT